MAYGTVNTDIVSDSSGGRLAPISSVFRNRIINGAMVIDQRNAGASVTITNTGGTTYTLDRMGAYGTQASKFSVQQNAGSVTPPVGFKSYLGVTSLSAYSVTSTDYFFLTQPVEGYNVADLGWGTADAKTVTLSFWVRSSLTGTFGGAIVNNAYNRSYPFSYTISSANTWEQKSITITGDVTGTWETTSSAGLRLQIGLGSGANKSGTAGSWAAAEYATCTGATSVVGTSGATFYITGVQLEVGSSATGYEYRLYNQELSACQRYYQLKDGMQPIGSSTTAVEGSIVFTDMRANPTIGQTAVVQIGYPGVTDYSQSSTSIALIGARVSTTAICYVLANFSGLTQGRPYVQNVATNNAKVTLSAEL